LIANNFISIQGYGSATLYGLNFTYSSNCIIANNSVSIRSNSTYSSYAIYLRNSTYRGTYVKNNIFANYAGGYSMYVRDYSNFADSLFSDYNNLYSNGSNLVYWNTSYTNLTHWQNNSGRDLHSVSLDPHFLSNTDLHINTAGLNNKGIALAAVNKDIDGEIRSSTPDIGADEFFPAQYDVTIVELVKPTALAPGSNPIVVKIKNFGDSTLNSLSINWEVNDVSQTTASFSSLSLNKYAETTVTIGNFAFSDGNYYTLKIWTSSPNGHVDDNPSNDTFCVHGIRTALSGEFTIGGSLADYPDFSSAINELIERGVCGAVKYRVFDGIYKEQLSIPEIKGASSTHPITFESYNKDSSKVEIQYSSPYSNDFVIELRGADYIHFKFLTIRSTSSHRPKVIELSLEANNNTFSNNRLICNSSLNPYYSHVIFSNSQNNDSNSFIHNIIDGGEYSLYLRGESSNNYNQNIIIKDNLITNFTYQAVSMQYQESPIISGNTIVSSSINSYSTGISLIQCSGPVLICNNNIKLKDITLANGINLEKCIGTVNSRVKIYNNFILLSGNVNASSNGFYISRGEYNTIANNTVKIMSTSVSSSNALYLYGGSNIEILNNNLTHFSGGYAINSPYQPSILSSDYNNLYSTGTYLGRWNNQNVLSLSSWKSKSSLDSHSVSTDPLFLDNDNLHIYSQVLDGAGSPISYINKDIDYETRNVSQPDIGADEYSFKEYDVALLKLNSASTACDNSKTGISIKIRNVGLKGISSLKTYWSINDSVQAIKTISCYLPPATTLTLTIDSHTFSGRQAHELKIWVDTLNINKPDQYHRNDTLKYSFRPDMKGTYTIGHSARDYNSFTEAVDDLITSSICGSVVFIVDTGFYDEQISIPPIIGTSATNTITFTTTVKDSTKTIIHYNSLSSYDNYILQLVGADYIRFEYFNFQCSNVVSDMRCIYITNGSHHNIFRNNKIGFQNSNTLNISGIYSTSQLNNYNKIVNNYVENCRNGIILNGADKGNLIKDNVITGFSSSGIYVNNQDSIIVDANIISGHGNYGINFNSCINGSKLINNKIILYSGSSSILGIYARYNSGTASERILIANNFISSFSGNSISGMYVLNNNYINIFHNSINLLSSGGNSNYAIRFRSSSSGKYGNINFKNNIVLNKGIGYVILVEDDTASMSHLNNSDYNIFYTNGPSFGVYGTTSINDINHWQKITSKDKNSFTALPLFINDSDLHLLSPRKYRINNPLPAVTTDIDGEIRSKVKPIVGADDLHVYALDAAALQLTNPLSTTCEGPSEFYAKIINEASEPMDSVEIEWSVNGNIHQPIKYFGRIRSFEEVTVYLGIDSLNATLKNEAIIKTKNPNGFTDQNPVNDSIYIDNFKIFQVPIISKIYHDTICRNSDALLKVSGKAENYLWYDKANSTNPISEDSFYVLKNLQKSKMLYVEGVTGGLPDSLQTYLLNHNLQMGMGNMFNMKALNDDLVIDSFGVLINAKKGIPVPIAVYYKYGTFTNYEKDSNAWTLVGLDTMISRGQNEYTPVSFGNIKVKEGEYVAIYISSTNPDFLLYSTEGALSFSNSDLKISCGIMSYYPFDAYFEKQKTWNGIVYYSKGVLCRSERDSVYAHVNKVPHVNLGIDTNFCLITPLILDAGAGPGFKYNWKYDLQSDTISTAQQLTIDSSGRYSVQVTDSCGFTAYDEKAVIIRENPVAEFTINDSSQCMNEHKFVFYNASIAPTGGKIWSYWDFGDGDHSLFNQPEHLYKTTGIYPVKLVIFADNGCSDTTHYDSLKLFSSPQSGFLVNKDTQCLNENNFSFFNASSLSQATLQYYWFFDDGGVSRQKDVNYKYSLAGKYNVMLVAISENDCNDTTSHSILVKPSPYVFLGNDTSLKTNQSILLSAGQGFDSYQWSDGGNKDTVLIQSPYAQTKTVWVIVQKDGCPNYDSINIHFDSLIGMYESFSNTELHIFPNPVTDYLNIISKTDIPFP
ncbi:MAG: hypothetical protein HOD63_07510, partial [Bacteroidetes bacterium]|nr:hypothetical protein [Bacteroidota bacterium]